MIIEQPSGAKGYNFARYSVTPVACKLCRQAQRVLITHREEHWILTLNDDDADDDNDEDEDDDEYEDESEDFSLHCSENLCSLIWVYYCIKMKMSFIIMKF